MIPKTIHYCWFGGNPKPELVCRCIDSWRRFCPDYEIIEWNENNFDVNCIPYVRDAYAAKKWAFVSDYARLKVVFERGVYLDTDVELKRNLDDLLQYDAWFAQDDIRWINTGLGFGAEAGHELIQNILVQRCERNFDFTICNAIDTPIIRNYLNMKQSRQSQLFGNIYIIGMLDYGQFAKHYESNSWKEKQDYIFSKRREGRFWKVKCFLRNPNVINFLERNGETRFSRVYVFFAYDFLDNGPVYFLMRLMKKNAKR